MLSLKLTCHVPESRNITVHLPDEIQPGEHELVLVIDHPPHSSEQRRRPGSAKGKLIILTEDDSHLKDFKEYMP